MRRILTTIISILFLFAVHAQNVIQNGNMEDVNGWSIYQLDVNPVAYDFNYTADGPIGGTDGCLRITNST
jgi:hypothetical protein